MSAILTILGRATRDPEMQQGKNSGTEYVSLDIAVSQRGQDGKEETIYYQCYFNKFLAERLAKAGVKKGTGLMIYGDLELHPFIYQKGKNAGQANAGPRINVKDWHFVPSNRSDKVPAPWAVAACAAWLHPSSARPVQSTAIYIQIICRLI